MGFIDTKTIIVPKFREYICDNASETDDHFSHVDVFKFA